MGILALASRDIPLDDSWDVIVVGGGPAGSAAATAAAREGAKTLLIEATGALGGMGTSALVPAWCPFSDKEKIVYRGIAAEVFAKAKRGVLHVTEEALDWVPIDSERLKRVYDDLVTGSGAEVLFHSLLSAVETDGAGTVEALIVANKAGLSAYKAACYVDCTGDADLAAWAGAEFRKGDGDGDLQPATHCFVLSNVDEYGYVHGQALHGSNPESPIFRILEEGRYSAIKDSHLCDSLVGPGTVGFNAGHLWNVDATDPVSVSRAMVEGRRSAAAFRDALAEYAPEAFANAHLCATGSVMGSRESRRIVGDYELCLGDYLDRKSFPDEICRNSYFIDVHHAEREIGLSRAGKIEGDRSRRLDYDPGESHGIPYRCLTPAGLRNVIVAGRSISCDRAVQGSVRVMPVCLAMGQAAGTAAAQAIAARSAGRPSPEVDVHAVDTSILRVRLREAGAYIH